MRQFTSNDKAFLDLVSNVLFENEINVDASVDFNAIYKEACYQAVSSLIFDAATSYLDKSSDIYKVWYKHTLHIFSNNYKIEYAHNCIGEVLSKNNIEYTTLKGCRSAFYYPYPDKRSLGDVDFLVRKCDLEKTCKVLEDNGFVKYKSSDDHEFHFVYIKDKVCYELHYCFDDTLCDESNNFTENLIKNAVEIPVLDGKGKIKTCDEVNHAIVMLIHMKRHLNSAGMGLRHLCDWAVFVNRYTSGEFIDKFKEAIENKGLWKFACALSLVANKYIGLPYKEWFGVVDNKVLDWLMEYIYSNGNFGRKDVSFAPLLSQNTNLGRSNLFIQFLISLRNIVCTHWKKAQNNIFLLCIGFVYFPVKYLIKSIFGKRKKVNLIETVKTGSEINYVFNQLGFYEK